MTNAVIPIRAIQAQSLNVIINGALIRIDLYQRSTGLYLDLWQNSIKTVAGAICQNMNPILHAPYLGLGGDLFFLDLQGSSDPTFDGLGSRYILIYADGI